MALTVSSTKTDTRQVFKCHTCGEVEVTSKYVSILYHRHDGALVVLTPTGQTERRAYLREHK